MRKLLCAVPLVMLLHCSQSGERPGFGDDDPEVDGGTSSGQTSQPDAGPGIVGDGSTADAQPGACTEDIDVVLAIDTSSSMNFVLEALESEFEQVVSSSNALKQGAHFGAVFFQDNVLLDENGDQEGGKVHLGSASLAASFRTMREVYTARNRNPADGPSGPVDQNPVCEENSLDALHVAATQFPWRPNAARIVVIVTDDTFLENPDNYGKKATGDWGPWREGDYPAASTVAETVAALQAANVKVFSFTTMNGRTSCGTGRRITASDAEGYGWSLPYNGAAPIPEQTSGQNFDLADVRSGTTHLDVAINDIVLRTHCGGVH